MGVKRSLEEEIFIEYSPEKHKRHDDGERHNSYEVEFPPNVTGLIVTSPGQVKSNSSELQYTYDLTDEAFLADKELESSLPISAVTSSSSEEDAGNGHTSFWNGYVDLDIPSRRMEHSNDRYISLLNHPPRKEIPLGPDYQAEVPQWDPDSRAKYFSDSNHFLVDNRDHQKLMGTCIIKPSGPNDLIIDGLRIGRGRTDCTCFDVGSMRCVQQHVTEAREKLRENIGDKAYAELGFYDMGEILATKWTSDEEQLFHEVIFSNPPSRGRKFWRHLRFAFPKRSTMELVSYYFNVFMLRRRAIQNRSYFLEIDSDDDEEHKGDNGDLYEKGSHSLDRDSDNDNIDDGHHLGPDGLCCIVKGDEEDSTIESIDDRDLDSSWVDDFWSEPDNPRPGFDVDENSISSGEID